MQVFMLLRGDCSYGGSDDGPVRGGGVDSGSTSSIFSRQFLRESRKSATRAAKFNPVKSVDQKCPTKSETTKSSFEAARVMWLAMQ